MKTPRSRSDVKIRFARSALSPRSAFLLALCEVCPLAPLALDDDRALLGERLGLLAEGRFGFGDVTPKHLGHARGAGGFGLLDGRQVLAVAQPVAHVLRAQARPFRYRIHLAPEIDRHMAGACRRAPATLRNRCIEAVGPIGDRSGTFAACDPSDRPTSRKLGDEGLTD